MTNKRSFGFFGKFRQSPLKGYVDLIGPDGVGGWVWDPSRPDLRLSVEVFIAGVPVGKSVAANPRDDLRHMGIGDGRYAFLIPLPAGAEPAAVEVRAGEQGLPLRRSSALRGPLDTAGVSPRPQSRLKRPEVVQVDAKTLATMREDLDELRARAFGDSRTFNRTSAGGAEGAMQLRQFSSLVGWPTQEYSRFNGDVRSLVGKDDGAALFEHFISYGLWEKRRFSRLTSIAEGHAIEEAIWCSGHLLATGWSEPPLVDPIGALILDNDDVVMVKPAVIRYWRDDVAAEFRTLPKQQRHGFAALISAQDVSGRHVKGLILRTGDTLLPTSITTTPAGPDEFVQKAFSVLQKASSYEEMVSICEQDYPFLEALRSVRDRVAGGSVSEFHFGEADPSRAPDLSVCTVLLGRSNLLKPFFVSLMGKRTADESWEVLLLANAGIDIDGIRHTAKWASITFGVRVSLFWTDHNTGFGGGMNVLASRARGSTVMLSNIDIRFTALDLPALRALMREHASLVAAYQFNPCGSLQHEGLVHDRRAVMVNGRSMELLDTRLLGRNTVPDELDEREVEYFGAACLVSDGDLLRSLGPFSEEFFYAYHEDCDLARRARAMGVRCMLSPALVIVHFESSGAVGMSMPLTAINAANLVTFNKAV